MTLTYFMPKSIFVQKAFEWEKLKIFIFLLDLLLLSVEMKSSQSVLNARGQGY